MLKSHIRTIDRSRDIEQTLIFGYLKFIFFNYDCLLSLNKLSELNETPWNNVLKFHIHTINRLRDIDEI